MSRWNALKKTYRMCTRLRAQRGGSRTGYLLDALWCSVSFMPRRIAGKLLRAPVF